MKRKSFAPGDQVEAAHILAGEVGRLARVCNEHDIMASLVPDGIEIQVLAIGITMEKGGVEHPVYMRLDKPVTIPFEMFQWDDKASTEELLKGAVRGFPRKRKPHSSSPVGRNDGES